MFVLRRCLRLRGDLSCVQIILVIRTHFACWTTLDHSHEVEGHFKPPLCTLMGSNATSSHLFADFFDKSLQNLVFLWKNGTYPEGRLHRPGLTELQNPPCGHILCARNSSNPHTFCILDHFGPLSCAPMPCIAISLQTSCENHEIIIFPIVKLTIPRGPDLILTPKI